jgi:hypothetical protein
MTLAEAIGEAELMIMQGGGHDAKPEGESESETLPRFDVPIELQSGVGVYAAPGQVVREMTVTGNRVFGVGTAIHVEGTVVRSTVQNNEVCAVTAPSGVLQSGNEPGAGCGRVGSNTCFTSSYDSNFDGFCDEGWGCAEGTDCFDCGYTCRDPTPRKAEPQACFGSESGVHPADGSEQHCRAYECKNGFKHFNLQRRTRREIHDWSDEEFQKFVKAVNALKNSPAQSYPFSYDAFVDMHSSAPNAHGGVEFLPWHRRFLQDFETQIQRLSNDCSMTVPYWNSAEETGDFSGSIVWKANRYGSLKSGCIQDGLAAGWVNEVGGCVRRNPKTTTDGVLPTWKTVVETLEALPQYGGQTGVCSAIENGLGHGPVHVMIGGPGNRADDIGDMATILSPRDPVFFLHHAFVDREFYYWQEYHLLHKTGAVTNSCGEMKECNRLGGFTDMANEFMGAFDPVDNCIAIPASDPTTCINYLPRSEAGWMSNTCAKVVGGLELGKCSVTSLKHDAEVDVETCDVHIDISEEYNVEWLKAMDEVHMQKGVGVSKPWQEKVADAKASFDLVRRELAASPKAAAETKEELVLCFRCADRWFTAECVDNPLA